MGFGADEGPAHGNVLPWIQALAFKEAGEIQGIAGQDMHGSGVEVLHEHQLPLGGAWTDRYDKAAHLLRAVVHYQAAGEQAVAHHVLQHVLAGEAGHDQRASYKFGGVINVLA